MIDNFLAWFRRPVSRRWLRWVVYLALASLAIDTALLGYIAFWVMP